MLKKSSPFLVTKGVEVKNPSFQMAFKAIEVKEDGSIKIKGYASTPDVDRYDDIVHPKAFKDAIEGYMKNPVVLLGHDANKVIGQVVDYSIDGKGLEVTAVLTNDIDNCFKNIVDKNLRGFSIGFICKAWGYKDEGSKQIREITALDLIEISVVSTPANPSALFTLSKSIRLLMDEQEKKNADEEEHKAKKDDTEEECPECHNPMEECTCDKGKKSAEGEEPPKEDPKTTEGEDKGGETPPPASGTPSEEGKTSDE